MKRMTKMKLKARAARKRKGLRFGAGKTIYGGGRVRGGLVLGVSHKTAHVIVMVAA